MVNVDNAHEVLWRMMGTQVEDDTSTLPVAEDCLFVLPGLAVRGLEKVRRFFAAYLQAYPDTVKHVQHVMRDDHTMVIRSIVTGRNTGTLSTVAETVTPTGLEVEWDIVEWLIVKDEVIVEWRMYQEPTPYIDALGAMRLADSNKMLCVAKAAEPKIVWRLHSPLDTEPRPTVKSGDDG